MNIPVRLKALHQTTSSKLARSSSFPHSNPLRPPYVHVLSPPRHHLDPQTFYLSCTGSDPKVQQLSRSNGCHQAHHQGGRWALPQGGRSDLDALHGMVEEPGWIQGREVSRPVRAMSRGGGVEKHHGAGEGNREGRKTVERVLMSWYCRFDSSRNPGRDIFVVPIGVGSLIKGMLQKPRHTHTHTAHGKSKS